MDTAWWGVFLTYLCVPAANMFPLLYGTTAPWYRSWTGRAIMVSKIGLALLVDAALLFHIIGNRSYRYHDQIILVAFAFITVGTYMYLFAFAREQYVKRNHPTIAARCPEEKP